MKTENADIKYITLNENLMDDYIHDRLQRHYLGGFFLGLIIGVMLAPTIGFIKSLFL